MTQANEVRPETVRLLLQGKMGIEIEEHRVDQQRHSLSQFDHPSQLGDRRKQPYFQTDFSESMEELITAPHRRLVGIMNQLHSLQQLLNEQLHPTEIIWPFSMPPRLEATDVQFLEQTFKREWYQGYRDLLLAKYGPFRHIMCGIHVSYSPAGAVVQWYQQQQGIADPIKAKNQLLFQITQQLVGFRWLLTYLYGASPLDENQTEPHEPIRSIRASRNGFANLPDVHINYDTLEGFIQEQAAAIQTGQLFAPSEFYGPVRLKGGNDLNTILQTGIEYLELRVLDDDPFALDGIQLSTLKFIRLLIIAGILFPHEWNHTTLTEAAKFNQRVAEARPTDPLPSELQKRAQELIDQLQAVVVVLPEASGWQAALNLVQQQISDPLQTTAARLATHIHNHSLLEFGFMVGKRRKEQREQETLTQQFPDIDKTLIPQYRYLTQVGVPFTVTAPTLLTLPNNTADPFKVTPKTTLATLQVRYQQKDKR
ncbi:glutamate--cysteine ligase [Fructilactobacillus hinvesii]|uniref:Glutamate--cysteine ligase n=1 Tax=Fructilactobacillus hinvesii TaxID=2940300 RepID=A0ABY5BRT9_9LACO|nr:glutamate--cysteine ligase [Fructilactobacillus hinvesii]USS87584.1 glutamate--cysteine ligase [Fructilactobacillus hinvesii]